MPTTHNAKLDAASGPRPLLPVEPVAVADDRAARGYDVLSAHTRRAFGSELHPQWRARRGRGRGPLSFSGACINRPVRGRTYLLGDEQRRLSLAAGSPHFSGRPGPGPLALRPPRSSVAVAQGIELA
jgi:hypothetical protein